MAIPCQNCGREYDVALFAFGRTISCTCGGRVGIAPRVRHLDESTQRRFVADAMLGRLARWLRLLGFDCAHDAGSSEQEIVHLAVSECRTLLTRDSRLPEEWWVSDIYLVREEEVTRQIAEVVQRFDLSSSTRILSRCSVCNRSLRSVTPAQVAERVPPRILELHDRFSECPECGRVYWEGSHVARIRSLAESLVTAA